MRGLLEDQKDIWTSPTRLKAADAKWVVPMAGITVGLIQTDRTSAYQIGRSSYYKTASQFSTAALAATVAGAGAAYLWGRHTENDQLRETGYLSTRALANALIVSEGLKYSFGRERPTDASPGKFFQGGSSFPSNHALLAWSVASVVAHEYQSLLVKLGAYGLASSISAARVVGRDHALSDVFIGALVGYEIGARTYKRHHSETVNYGTFLASDLEAGKTASQIGSTYVPVGSWVYPALERLIALGYVERAFLGQRPWSRMSCAAMLQEAHEKLDGDSSESEAMRLVRSLDGEFSAELGELDGKERDELALESLYTRVVGIAGSPVNDSYHFGQTIINDFGRHYQEGFNNVIGFSARAHTGRYSFFATGEYQHAPGAGALPLAARQAIASADAVALKPAMAVPATDQFRLLDTYVSTNAMGMKISVGKQSLWWGPNRGGAMLMSNNAEPIWMLRVNSLEPVRVPLLSTITGPFRTDSFFGKLSGHESPAHPFFYGQKISFKPTPNLEFGFSRATVFAGDGHVPLTIDSFLRSFFSFQNVSASQKFSRRDPGSRHAGFDFSYRLPFLRNWVTVYSDSIVHDDVSAISAPRRASWNPGVYLSHFPGIAKLDFRAEAANTDPPTSRSTKGQFFYWESFYKDGYLNKHNLMGSWVGREGKGYQAWLTYWFTPQNALQVSYRQAKAAKDFIPGGTTQNIGVLKANVRLRQNVNLRASVQYESWLIPILSATRKSDVSTLIELRVSPNLRWRQRTE